MGRGNFIWLGKIMHESCARPKFTRNPNEIEEKKKRGKEIKIIIKNKKEGREFPLRLWRGWAPRVTRPEIVAVRDKCAGRGRGQLRGAASAVRLSYLVESTAGDLPEPRPGRSRGL
uniref:Uncharacterized protein n=1 Tax=Ananas comosus var. bracteatus TaxID=296719 RepID=A0A6V7QB54_ANACO|nr:unnamed protein product [Ananas comosus var. bracteatus]